MALLLCSACSGAAANPSIEGESASKVTSTGATLEAQINPGDAPDGVYYQFQIGKNLGEHFTEIVCPPEPTSGPSHPCVGTHSTGALPITFVAAASGSSSVSLDLTGTDSTLQPGTSYQYRVLVAKAIQSEDTTEWEVPAVIGDIQTFTTPSAAPPSIEGKSASKITPTGATLEAQINPGDAPDGIYYQFQIVRNPGEYAAEIVCPPEPASGPFHPCIGDHLPGALPIGFIPAGSELSAVSLDLSGAGVTLQPGTTYHYRVVVAPAVLTEDATEWESPAIDGPDQIFTTPPQPSPTGEPDPQAGGTAPTLTALVAVPPVHRHHRRHHRRHHHRKHDRRSPRS